MATKNRGGGRAKSGLYFGVTMILIASMIFGWVKVNNIHSAKDAYGFFKSWSDRVSQCLASDDKSLVNWNCDESKGNSNAGENNTQIPGSNTQKPEGEMRKDVNYTPAKPSEVNDKAPKSNDNSSTIFKGLDSISIEEEQKVSYKRSEWKHWIGKPCDTRETVLKTQGVNVKTDPKTCEVLSGEWKDLYHNNDKITDDSKLDVDHTIPLGYAAKHGGQNWTPDKKQQFANDLSQLLAVSAKENRSKSDKGPAEYMPTDNFKCNYSKIWVSTAIKYGVQISSKDKEALKKGLQLCSQK